MAMNKKGIQTNIVCCRHFDRIGIDELFSMFGS